MQIGTGLQNKLLEAMAMNLPSITSPLANEALGAKENEEILIATTPQENANHIISLLTTPPLAQKLSTSGNDFVKTNYRWETYGTLLENTAQQTIETSKQH